MFNKLKQFRDMRSQAKQLQNQLSQEIVSIKHQGIQIVMDGNQEIKELQIDAKYLTIGQKEKLEQAVKQAFKEAIKKVQRKMAQKMMKEKGFSGLTDMLQKN